MISTLPLAKVSILMAEGNLRSLEISLAAASSGLMARERFISSRIKLISVAYSGFRILAMVWQFPAFFAIRQQSMFSSSELVVAISRSASSIPASICTA